MLISASGFASFVIAFINIVVLMTMLGHRKYQYLFCRENQGKIICPHECPLELLSVHVYQEPGVDQKLFEWKDGPLVLAMREGSMFLIDEISLADDSVLERLNR